MLSLWNRGAKLSTPDNQVPTHDLEVVLWNATDDGQDVGRLIQFFEGVAASERWEPGEALQQWQHRSVYFVLEIEARLAGGLQLVLPVPTPASPLEILPCQSLWPEVPVPRNTSGAHGDVAHVAMMALEESMRGEGTLFWHLVIEMWRWCVGEGINTLFLEVTPRVLPLYQRLGWPLVIRGELRRHWGEDCYLCTLGIPDVAEAILRRAERSPYYRQIVAQAFRVTLHEDRDGIPLSGTRESLTFVC